MILSACMTTNLLLLLLQRPGLQMVGAYFVIYSFKPDPTAEGRNSGYHLLSPYTKT